MRFNYSKMRRTFYEWHSGQSSPLYAAASSGLVNDVAALQRELRQCAELLWQDSDNFKYWHVGIRQATASNATESTMKAKPYAEWQYLKRVTDALPTILSGPFVHPFDNREYRALPWSKVQHSLSKDYF